MPGSLVLIASYPKSGNTWVRLVLQRLLNTQCPSRLIEDVRETGINAIDIGLYGYHRRVAFDSLAPADASELLPEEIDCFLPLVYAQLAQESSGAIYIKTHERLRRNRDGQWLFPPQHVRAVLYIVRHPFDVAVSQANHLGISMQEAVSVLADPVGAIALAGPKLPLPLQEFAGSWSGNVASWLAADAPYPIHVVRYEDIYANDISLFGSLATAAGIQVSPQHLEEAVLESRFDRVQQTEQQQGFRERPSSSPAFFRSGKPKGWHGLLNAELQQRLAADHAVSMARLGYHPDGTWGPLSPLNLHPK